MSEPEDRPSPRVLRLAAAILDFTIVVVIVLPIQLLWTTGAGTDRTPTTGSNWLALAVIAAYPIASLALRNCTAGKWLFNLRVQRSDGRPVGWTASAVRFVVSVAPIIGGFWIPSIPEGAGRTAASIAQVALMLAIYLPIVFDPLRRGLHDRVAGTYVTCKVPALFRDPSRLLDGAE